MSCLSCTKPYTLFRKEKGCPGCGFSFCAKCLNNEVFLKKLNKKAKVCKKCSKSANEDPKPEIAPPDAYFKRLGMAELNPQGPSCKPNECNNDHADQQIWDRLNKLKEGKEQLGQTSEQEIAERLKKMKGDLQVTSDSEIQERLARLRGVPISTIQHTTLKLPAPDTKTEQEQADELMKQFLEQTQIDSNYKDEFDQVVAGMECRLQNLKDNKKSYINNSGKKQEQDSSEDEEETVNKIVEKLKAESSLEPDDNIPSTIDELPFCEICNEDATLRCLGCHYLFCKRCYLDHRDDDDGCNKYEPYTPPKNKS